MKLLSSYLVIINIITMFVYGYDKYLAKKRKKRIKEKKLLFFSFLGGSAGAIMGTYIFSHKTSKLKFKIINILMLFIWIAFYIWIWRK